MTGKFLLRGQMEFLKKITLIQHIIDRIFILHQNLNTTILRKEGKIDKNVNFILRRKIASKP